MPRMMRDDELGPSNRKHPRDTGYKADDDNSDPRLHSYLKKPKRYVVVLDEEEEPGELEDDQDWDLDYNPFFNESLFRDSRRTREEAAEGPKVKKEESIMSNSIEKALEDAGYPFKKINEDDVFVEDDQYELRNTNSLR